MLVYVFACCLLVDRCLLVVVRCLLFFLLLFLSLNVVVGSCLLLLVVGAVSCSFWW